MMDLKSDTSRGEVNTPTKEQFIQLLESYDLGNWERTENHTFSEDGKKMTFDIPQEIKLTIKRKGSISAVQYPNYSGADISDWRVNRDYDSPFTLEFQWGQETIKLTDSSAYGILHRFAKALTAITEYERE